MPGRRSRSGPGPRLVYREEKGNAISLLEMPTGFDWQLWTAPMSMRDVEPSVNLVHPRRGTVRRAPSQRGSRPRAASRHPTIDDDLPPEGELGEEPASMTVKRKEPPRVGAVRPSQLMYAFGVGSTVDLPNFSVVVAGLDAWDETNQEVLTEPRLLDAVQAQLGRPGRRAPVRSMAGGDAERVRRVGVDGRPCRAVPALAAVPAMPTARADRLGPVPAQAARLPAGPDPVRPPELHRQGQAADGRPGAVRRGLSAGSSRRVPVDRVRARGRRRAPGIRP